MSVVLSNQTVKCRKKHQCRYCGQRLNIGETAIARSGADNDGMWRIYFHPECEPLTHEWDQVDWETISPGEYKRPTPPLAARG